MNEIREEILELLNIHQNATRFKISNDELAYEIFHLLRSRGMPTEGTGILAKMDTGFITRELTWEEVGEWARQLINFCEEHPLYNISPDRQALTLPSGETVEVKK